MKKIKIIFCFLFFVIINNMAYAKYVYNFDENIMSFTRDSLPINASVTYSTEEWTNGNVIVTITTNKPVEQVSGFILSDDKKTLTKEVTQNESNTIIIRDLSGNSTEIEYSVDNIDKENPQIIGCEDGKTYNAPLNLDYQDNVEVKNVKVNKYGDKLIIDSRGIYRDNKKYFGIDRTDTTLKVTIEESPLNTMSYKYYINDVLYSTTTEKQYIFTGLQKGTNYKISVEAINNQGIILDKAELPAMTSYYSSIESQKTSENFIANLKGLDSKVTRVRYAVWNKYHESDVNWYESIINNNMVFLNCNKMYQYDTYEYVIHVYFYDSIGNVLDIVGFSVDLNNNYIVKDSNIDINLLNESGNYQIVVEDLAGNKITYYIKIE